MEWIKIDKDNLPENEVLAGNFGTGTYGYKEKTIGYLFNYLDKGNVVCANIHERVQNCTHYFDIHKHDINQLTT